MTISTCSVNGCQNAKRRNGPKSLYCDMHYARFLRNGVPGNSAQIKVQSYGDLKCSVSVCSKNAEKKNLCTEHYDVQKRTDIDVEKIALMKESGCQVCASKERLTVDHDHSCCPTGKVCEKCIRGILCHKCNTAAGLLDDDTDRMIGLAMYILSSKDVLANV